MVGGIGLAVVVLFLFLFAIILIPALIVVAFNPLASFDDSNNETSNSNKCYDLVYTNISDEQKYAEAITKHVRTSFPQSPWLTIPGGPGKYAVAGGKKYDVNPSFAVCIAQHESGFGSCTGCWADTGNSHNSFGRSATESQPHAHYGSWTIYAWPSWEASLDSNDSEYQFLSEQYIHKGFKCKNLECWVVPYAGTGPNPTYVNFIKDCEDNINQIAGNAISCN